MRRLRTWLIAALVALLVFLVPVALAAVPAQEETVVDGRCVVVAESTDEDGQRWLIWQCDDGAVIFQPVIVEVPTGMTPGARDF